MGRAIKAWGQMNIKHIGYAEIEDFLLSQKIEGSKKPVSSKSRANIKSTLHSFWNWLRKRRILTLVQIPEFPETPFELSVRKTIDKDIQQAIIEEIHRISFHINPKIWMGIKFLATYISVRPGELLNIKEGDFDLSLGVVIIPHPKEKKAKTVPLLEEDVEILRSIPRGLPDLYFFRHVSGVSGVKAGQKFGEKYLYKWWKKACDNLEIYDVDLYGGTRHSSAMALREFHSPEEIKRATMHTTNKAFERYFNIPLEDVRNIYQNTKKAAPKLHHDLEQPEKAKILKLKE
jgi:integrase